MIQLFLSELQAANVKARMRENFEEWKATKLKIRAAHLEALLQAKTLEAADIRRVAIRTLDRDIAEREKALEFFSRAIDANVIKADA